MFDFNAKMLGVYDIPQVVKEAEMSINNQLYIINPEKLSIYRIETAMKNRLEKMQEFDMNISFVKPIGSYLLVRKDDACLLYDSDYELVMKEDMDEE